MANELDEHPTVAAWQRWYGRLPPGATYHIDDPPVQAFAGGRAVINNYRRGICGIGHRGIAERDHDLVRRIGHQSYRGADDHRQRAFAASQRSEERRVGEERSTGRVA